MIDLEKIEQDYTAPEIPPCPICGGPTEIGSIHNGTINVACAAMVERWRDVGYKGLTRGERDHWRNGTATVHSRADSRVLALVRAVRAAIEVSDNVRAPWMLANGSIAEAERLNAELRDSLAPFRGGS
jgi:hypothetical protein